jgi:hypothetical protein
MAGAYVAKPDVPEEVDLPPGWNINWPHPGPWPPGYTPDLGLGLVAQATVVPGSAVTDITATLTDQDDYVTTEPATPVIWTAAWDDTGDMLTLKLSGDDDLLSSISVAYSALAADFWGSDPDIEFDISASDNGRSFTLSASSTPFPDNSVSANAVITVVLTPPVKSVRFTITWSGTIPNGAIEWQQFTEGGGSAPAESWGSYIQGSGFDWEGYPAGVWVITSPSENTTVMTGSPVDGGTHVYLNIWRWVFSDGPSGTLTHTAELLSDGEVVASEVTVVSISEGVNEGSSTFYRDWADIDVDAETISLQSIEG